MVMYDKIESDVMWCLIRCDGMLLHDKIESDVMLFGATLYGVVYLFCDVVAFGLRLCTV